MVTSSSLYRRDVLTRVMFTGYTREDLLRHVLSRRSNRPDIGRRFVVRGGEGGALNRRRCTTYGKPKSYLIGGCELTILLRACVLFMSTSDIARYLLQFVNVN